MSHAGRQWREDGTPVGPRRADRNRAAAIEADGASGSLAATRHVFLRGCGLLSADGSPGAWRLAPRWHVLETGFGLGLNFLATWLAWRADAERPDRLFYSACETHPVEARQLLRNAAAYSELTPLAGELAAAWRGLDAGVHRLRLNGGAVQLTLAIGDAASMLGELSGSCDTVFLDGFSPGHSAATGSRDVLRRVARLARVGTRAASRSGAREVQEGLMTLGFQVERVAGLMPGQHTLCARFAPRWTPRRRPGAAPLREAAVPARCAIIGGGIAGACAARELAERGWQVTVLDAAEAPAAGASGLPAGIVSDHVSRGDSPLSRLTRAGARATLERAAALLAPGVDFARSGVLERLDRLDRLAADCTPVAIECRAAGADGARATADFDQKLPAQAGLFLEAGSLARWHADAGWLRPAKLVQALLALDGRPPPAGAWAQRQSASSGENGAPAISWRGGTSISRIEPCGAAWRLIGADGAVVIESELVVLAAGFASAAILAASGLAEGAPPLHALHGQLAFGPMPAGSAASALPPFPINGHGSLITGVPLEVEPIEAATPGDTSQRTRSKPGRRPAAPREGAGATRTNTTSAAVPCWIAGATFERELAEPVVTESHHQANAARLRELLPRAAAALAAQWPEAGRWAGVRATLPDRLPAVGAWAGEKLSPGLRIQLLTGFGARGMTLAPLCAEILVAWLHNEPLPVARSLAERIGAWRWHGRS